jgi:hypothetical protein
VRDKEPETLAKILKLLSSSIPAPSPSLSQAVLVGDWVHILQDMDVPDDDSDDDDYDPEESDDDAKATAGVTRTPHPRRGQPKDELEPDSLDRPPLFKDSSIKDINHLLSPVPHSKLRAGIAVDVDVKVFDTLYENVSENQWKPLHEVVDELPWDEAVFAWLRDLLPLLDRSRPLEFREAVVYFA